MNITLEYKISEKEMKLYEFTIAMYKQQIYATYSFFWHSRRNDENDIWGHLWSDHFRVLVAKEERAFEELHDYYPDGWGCENSSLDHDYDKIRKKYNPILQKTVDGLPYLQGESSSSWHKLPKIELPPEVVEQKIKQQLHDMVNCLELGELC